MYKKNFATLTLFILTATCITTNSMEIVPFKKTNNVICNYNKAEDDIELPIQQHPTIKANLYINHKNSKAHYIGLDHYKSINKAGIVSSIENQQKMPVISIIVMADQRDWTKSIPKAIVKHEWKNNLTEEEQEKQFNKICRKKFPYAIPADILYGCKTNDSINLTVHGYPVIATCSDNPKKKVSFKEHFTQHIDNFNKKPAYFINLEVGSGNVEKELQDAGLIYDFDHHGPNRFTSIDKLILEDKNISNMFRYLQQREFGGKLRIT